MTWEAGRGGGVSRLLLQQPHLLRFGEEEEEDYFRGSISMPTTSDNMMCLRNYIPDIIAIARPLWLWNHGHFGLVGWWRRSFCCLIRKQSRELLISSEFGWLWWASLLCQCGGGHSFKGQIKERNKETEEGWWVGSWCCRWWFCHGSLWHKKWGEEGKGEPAATSTSTALVEVWGRTRGLLRHICACQQAMMTIWYDMMGVRNYPRSST